MSLGPIRAALAGYRRFIFLRDGGTLHIRTEEISKEILGILQVNDAEMRSILWQVSQPSPERCGFRQNPFRKPIGRG